MPCGESSWAHCVDYVQTAHPAEMAHEIERLRRELDAARKAGEAMESLRDYALQQREDYHSVLMELGQVRLEREKLQIELEQVSDECSSHDAAWQAALDLAQTNFAKYRDVYWERDKLRDRLAQIRQLEDTMADADVPAFFELATGKKWRGQDGGHLCVNDIRALAMLFWNQRVVAEIEVRE